MSVPVVALGGLLVVTLPGCGFDSVREQPRQIVENAHAGGSALAFAPDSRIGASGGLGGGIRLWRVPEGTPLARWRAHAGNVTGLMFLNGGRELLSTGWDGRLRLWDDAGHLLHDWQVGAPVSSFAAAPDRESVLLGLTDGRVAWWSPTGGRFRVWQTGDQQIAAVALDRGGRQFAAADIRGRVWRWQRKEEPQALQRPPTYARALVFDPRDGALVGGGWFRLFRWLATATELSTIPTDHRGIINHLEFAPDGAYLASISRQTDSAVLFLDPSSGATLRAFRKHALCGRRVALSPDGRRMMSTADDASVRFYVLEP